jgi:PAS domain S-box-containing protein
VYDCFFGHVVGRRGGPVNVINSDSAQQNLAEAPARRPDELAALFRFTDRLYRSQTPMDSFDAALDAICEGLRCDRASILLFDHAGTMRFAAWRDLSETYRKAVDGHSPWHAGQRNPDPIFIEDIEQIPDLAPLLPVAKSENIRALAFVPLVANGGTIGKFMAYYPDSHAFTRGESDLAVTVARQLGFSLERARAEEARSKAEDIRSQLASIIESSQDAIVSKDLTGKIISWNPGAERMFGYSAEEAVGRSVLMLIPPDRQSEESEILRKVRSGERVEHYETVRVRKDGTQLHLSLTISPVKGPSGTIIGASKIARDITDRRRADEHRTLLINELNHRVKNTLATVQSIAVQTLRTTERSADARLLFEARLAALSRAHDVLTTENWSGANVRDIVRRTLEPFQTPHTDIVVDGPSIHLSPKQALAIAMALHELATNAVKYGALSSRNGGVTVAWRKSEMNGRPSIELTWSEQNGPRVAPPSRRGFGARMIQLHLAAELGGEASLDFRPEGIVCKIASPLGWGLDQMAASAERGLSGNSV